jgi:O-antigen/teichoic acid export membrane protein
MDEHTPAAVVIPEAAPANPGPAASPSHGERTERLRLMWDGVVNYSGFVCSGIAGIILVPVMLRYLGEESYGLWLAAMAVWGTFSSFDFGLYWSITREVSSAVATNVSAETDRFVSAAGNLYLLFGLAGGAAIAFLGLPFSRGLHLSGNNRSMAPEVFAFVAIAFAADRLVQFSSGVLAGLRRFGIMNALAAGAALARLVGSLALLWTGHTVVAIALWNAILCGLWAAAALTCVRAIQPQFSFRAGPLRWKLVRPHLSFGLLSFLTELSIKVMWDLAPLVIGFLCGSAAIVPYSIGRRFPIALNHVNSRAAETLFPAASERKARNDSEGSRSVLQLGTRWILVTALPVCIVLWILAPGLLHAWVGEFSAEGSLILRLTCAAVLAQGLGMGAMQVLWGRGEVHTLVKVLGVLAAPSLALTVALVWLYGEVGAAVALCVALVVTAAIFLLLGARACEAPLWGLVRDAFRGLLLPAAGCAALAYLGVWLVNPQHWAGVIAVSLGAGMSYVAILYFTGAREEEKEFVRQALGLGGRLSVVAHEE